VQRHCCCRCLKSEQAQNNNSDTKYGVGGGKAEMITEASNLQETVLRQLARALQPVVTDISMYWGGLSVTPAPCVLRPLFHGEPYRVYGFVNDSSLRQEKYLARLTGRIAGSSVHFDLVVEPSRCGAVSACSFGSFFPFPYCSFP